MESRNIYRDYYLFHKAVKEEYKEKLFYGVARGLSIAMFTPFLKNDERFGEYLHNSVKGVIKMETYKFIEKMSEYGKL